MTRREMLKSEVAPANKSLCHDPQPITTMLFGDELPQRVCNISQIKRMAAKSIGHDRRKGSPSTSASTNYIISRNLVSIPVVIAELMTLLQARIQDFEMGGEFL